jgi:hypothetical protein
VPRRSTWKRVMSRLRQELGDVEPPAATAPCPSCTRAVPVGYGSCPFCAAKIGGAPSAGPLITTPGAGLPHAVRPERVAAPSYVPHALAPELAARKAATDRADAEARAHRRRRRKAVLQSAPLVVALPWLPCWSLFPAWLGVLLFVADVAVNFAHVRVLIRKGGDGTVGMLVFMPWTWIKMLAGVIVLGKGYFLYAMPAALVGICFSGVVGIAVALEREDLEHS